MGLILSHFCCILDIPALGIIVVSEKKIYFFYHVFFSYLSLSQTQGAWLAGFIKGTTIHCYIYTKYKSPGLCDFREENLYGFPIVSLWGLMTLGA